MGGKRCSLGSQVAEQCNDRKVQHVIICRFEGEAKRKLGDEAGKAIPG